MPSQPTRRLSVFYGHIASNIGDLAINTGTIDLIRAALPGARIEFVLLNSRKSPFLEMGLTSFGEGVSLQHFDSHSSRMKPYLDDPATFFADCGIETPEGVLLASGEHLFDYGTGENDKSLFWRSLPGYAALRLGLPAVQLPATFGPYSGQPAADLVGALARMMGGIAARDTRSRDLMAQLAPDRPLPLHLDPAFHIAAPGALEERARAQGAVGLAMRSDGWGIRFSSEDRRQLTGQFRTDGYASSRSYQISRRLLDHVLTQTGDRVRLFVQTAADQDLAERLQETCAAPDRVTLCAPASVTEYIHELGQLDRVYTSRFHAVILALLAGTPAYAVYFDAHGHKMPGLFELLGWPEACANGSALAPESILRLFLKGQEDEALRLPPVLAQARALRQAGRDWLAGVARDTARDTAPAARPEPPASSRDLRRMRGALDRMALGLRLDIRLPAVPRGDLARLQELCGEARVILDYGAEAFTLMAADMPGKLVIGVSDDPAWVRALRARLIGAASPVLLHLVRPAPPDENPDPDPGRDRLPESPLLRASPGAYAGSVWDQPFFRDPDLIRIGGPGAGACLATILRRLRKPARLLFEAYADEPARPQIDRIVTPARLIGRMAQFDLTPGLLRPGESGFLSPEDYQGMQTGRRRLTRAPQSNGRRV